MIREGEGLSQQVGLQILAELVGVDGASKEVNARGVECVVAAVNAYQSGCVQRAIALAGPLGVRPYMGWASLVASKLAQSGETEAEQLEIFRDTVRGYRIFAEFMAHSDMTVDDVTNVFLTALSGSGLPANVANTLANQVWIEPENWSSWANRIFNPFSDGKWFEPPTMPKTALAYRIGTAMSEQYKMRLLAGVDVTPEATEKEGGPPDIPSVLTLRDLGTFVNSNAMLGGPHRVDVYAELPNGGPFMNLIRRAARWIKRFRKKHPVVSRLIKNVVQHGLSKIPILGSALAIKRGLVGGPEDFRYEKLVSTGMVHPHDYKHAANELLSVGQEANFDFHPAFARDLRAA